MAGSASWYALYGPIPRAPPLFTNGTPFVRIAANVFHTTLPGDAGAHYNLEFQPRSL